MTPGFQATLPGSRSYDPAAVPQESFLETAWAFNKCGGRTGSRKEVDESNCPHASSCLPCWPRRMIVHSAAIMAPHTWGSRPRDWVLNERGVAYWGSPRGEGAVVYLLGNPAVIW